MPLDGAFTNPLAAAPFVEMIADTDALKVVLTSA